MNKNKKTKKSLVKFTVLVSKTVQLLKQKKVPLTKIIVIYAALYLIFISGLNTQLNYQDVLQLVQESKVGKSGWFSQNISVISNLFSNVGTTQGDAASLMQIFLFVLATMACIWLFNNKSVSVRSAFYDGTARLVPFLLVIVMLFVTLIPTAIGSSIFSIAQGAGAQGTELISISLLSGVLLLLSVYWLSSWVFAIYYASEKDSAPIASIKLAVALTKGYRFWLVRNFVLFVICVLVLLFSVMLPIVIILPFIAAYVAYALCFVLFAVTQAFLFVNFRSLKSE